MTKQQLEQMVSDTPVFQADELAVHIAYHLEDLQTVHQKREVIHVVLEAWAENILNNADDLL